MGRKIVLVFLWLSLHMAVLGSLSSCQSCQTKNANVESKSFAQALLYAKDHLAKRGKLIQKSDGYAYLKVDDDYIHKLFPLLGLSGQGFSKPPYFRRPDAPGAHISVFYKDDGVRLKDEVDHVFSFELDGIEIVRVNNRVSYVVLKVIAPDLIKLRLKYGRSPKLLGHEFHITLAKKNNRR